MRQIPPFAHEIKWCVFITPLEPFFKDSSPLQPRFRVRKWQVYPAHRRRHFAVKAKGVGNVASPLMHVREPCPGTVALDPSGPFSSTLAGSPIPAGIYRLANVIRLAFVWVGRPFWRYTPVLNYSLIAFGGNDVANVAKFYKSGVYYFVSHHPGPSFSPHPVFAV